MPSSMHLPILPENSAQGTNFTPNPFVRLVLGKLTSDRQYELASNPLLVDLGCGKLRHLRICKQFAHRILLVDTQRQIERTQKFAEKFCTMNEYIDFIKDKHYNIRVQTIEEFEADRHEADIVLSAAVMDVVPRNDRIRMVRAAFRNLRRGGYFVVIVPRNDSSVLKNCTNLNRFLDGFRIHRKGHKSQTFYANFRDPRRLLTILKGNGFVTVEDLSEFRQLCLILQTPLDQLIKD